MTEAEWLAATDPAPMFPFCGGKASDRKLRLLGCGCCRRAWSIIPDDPSRQIVEAVERYVDGNETPVTVGRLRKRATRSDNTRYLHPYHLAVRTASARSTEMVLQGAVYLLAWDERLGIQSELCKAERAVQASILRDIFGNPFRPVAFSPEWRTDTAVSLARQMYDSRDFGAMPILADALQDAGCDSDDILAHCRDPQQVHARGCWVVDLVLGKA